MILKRQLLLTGHCTQIPSSYGLGYVCSIAIEQCECRADCPLQPYFSQACSLGRALGRRVALRRGSKPNAWKFQIVSPWHDKLV